MKRLHWMILRMLPGPFLGWLGTLMFLLLMQFLIHYLPDIAGKGLAFSVIVELVVYSLAYMLVLAVPMSVLLATLMTFGRLAETRAYAVVKSSGISLLQIVWPVLLVGVVVTGGMVYFNNVVLPEANFRAKNLWRDVRVKKPGFELRPGVFYNGLSGYSILVEETHPATSKMEDITIYDYTSGERQSSVIKARRGRIETVGGGRAIVLTLEDGEMHRLQPGRAGQDGDRYERLAFRRHQLRLDLSDFIFERSGLRESYRSDRTMRTSNMINYVDSLRMVIADEQADLRAATNGLTAPDTLAPAEEEVIATPTATPKESAADSAATSAHRMALAGLDVLQRQRIYSLAQNEARSTQSRIENAGRVITWKAQRADQYLVEIYKKFSIATACFMFVLIGAPLGLSIRRGGLGTVGGLALGIFLFYWVTLVQGEKLADRGLLVPWVGMWIANLIMLLVGLWLVLYVSLDLRATPPLRRRLWDWLRSW